MQYFRTEFLEEADRFISTLNEKAIRKIFYNIDLAQQTNDPKLFKKLDQEIWEFRTKYNGLQIRLLAFWDKEDKVDTIVFATHGFIKKVDKVVPKGEIERAVRIKENYFTHKKRKS